MKANLLIFFIFFGTACANENEGNAPSAQNELAESSFSLGVGDRSFDFDQCIIRQGTNPKRIQLVASSKSGKPRMHLEFPYSGEKPLLNEKNDPGLFVLALENPLATDEDPTYENKDVTVIISKYEEKRIHGRVRGRVSDLLLGRPHEIRGRFICSVDR